MVASDTEGLSITEERNNLHNKWQLSLLYVAKREMCNVKICLRDHFTITGAVGGFIDIP